ncbi:MAG: AAA family ATPase [Syntrophobacterales bacterium]|nr:AAA family ATPase [Syntrophobacterales bacterium]
MIADVKLIEPVSMIVLTGGPCSGKSSSLAYLTERLSDHGFMVFIVPETATLITSTGIDRQKMDRTRQVAMFEETIFDMQLTFEEIYKKAVTDIFPDRRKVILLDRGIMDIKAFMPQENFKAMLKRKGLSEVNVRDRYNGVIHLVTAAEGAEEYYTGENNTARIESPEEARSIDLKTRENWLGHPHFRIIDNRTDFKGKIKRTFETISQFLGIYLPLNKKEKYLVRSVEYEMLPTNQIIHIEEVCLRTKNSAAEGVHIRKRGQQGSYLYFLSRRRATKHADTWIEEEELIAEQEYLTLKTLIDPKTDIVEKERICFFWDNQYFELDRYKGRLERLIVLNVEYGESSRDEAGRIPPFVLVDGNITGDPRYLTQSMAVKTKKVARASESLNKKKKVRTKGTLKDT